MCTVLLPPGVYPIAVKYIISYHIIIKRTMTSGENGLTKTHYRQYFIDNVGSIYNTNTDMVDRGTLISPSDW